MAIVRAQVRFQGDTNTPEDVYVNTFHFNTETDGLDQTVSDAIGADLAEFYFNSAPVAGNSIKTFLSPAIASAELRTYNLADAEPRVPFITSLTYGTASSQPPLPAEIAVCLSLQAAPPVTPSRRGRIYIGPLNTNASASAQTSDARVDPGFRATLAEVAFRLLDTGTYEWVIHSPTTGTNPLVAGGFIDDAYDIQRRRGHEATARTLWGL